MEFNSVFEKDIRHNDDLDYIARRCLRQIPNISNYKLKYSIDINSTNIVNIYSKR
jgi:hypothetical protein